MSNRTKGFTLIELLAVIVVLAIIALIATPIILNIIEKTKLSSFKSSVLNGSNAIEYKLLEVQLSDIPKNGISVSSLKLKSDFKSGKYNKDLYGKLVAVNITNGEYCANGDVTKPTITKGDCSDLLILPEDRMMDSYVSDELWNLYMTYVEDLENVSTEEVERVTNLLQDQFNQQIYYYLPNDYSTVFSEYKGIEKVMTLASKEVPANAVYSKDISYNQNGAVMLWFLDEDNN